MTAVVASLERIELIPDTLVVRSLYSPSELQLAREEILNLLGSEHLVDGSCVACLCHTYYRTLHSSIDLKLGKEWVGSKNSSLVHSS